MVDVEEIKARWAGLGPWRGEVNSTTGVLEVGLEPHGYADVIYVGDMEVVNDKDLRNMEAIGHAPEDIAYLLEQHLEVRPVIATWARRMEARLRDHDADRGPEGWRTATPAQLYDHLTYYQNKLKQAIVQGLPAPTIVRQAESAMNLLMMLVDVVEQQADPHNRRMATHGLCPDCGGHGFGGDLRRCGMCGGWGLIQTGHQVSEGQSGDG